MKQDRFLIGILVGIVILIIAALAVFFLAGMTDGLDGLVARVFHQKSKLGAYLDPLADKLLLTSGFITLSMIHLIPLWVTILVVSRDVILLLGTAVAHFTDSRVDLTPTFLGKGTTFLQLSYVVMVIFLSSRRIDLTVILPLLFGMISFTLLSGLHYLYRGIRHTSAISS